MKRWLTRRFGRGGKHRGCRCGPEVGGRQRRWEGETAAGVEDVLDPGRAQFDDGAADVVAGSADADDPGRVEETDIGGGGRTGGVDGTADRDEV
jgi:hypothetical protein